MVGIRGISTPGPTGGAVRGRTAPSPRQAPEPSRAVTVVTPVAAPERPPQGAPQRRPSAAFLAHLIATRTQAPQTRERRRAEPAVAAAAYGAAPRRITTGRLLAIST